MPAFFWKKRRSAEIDPEEIFMDSANLPGHDLALHEGRIERPIEVRVFWLWALIIFVGLLAVVLRLFQLQIIRGEEFFAASNKNISYSLFSAPPRGLIYDRNLNTLASNSVSFTLILKKTGLADDEFGTALQKGADLVGRTLYEIWAGGQQGQSRELRFPDDIFSPDVWPEEIVLAESIPRHLLLRVATSPGDFHAMAIEESINRVYPGGSSASHVVGFTGRPAANDQAQSPLYQKASARIGKGGIELVYEEELRGKHGKKVIEIDAEGKPQRERFLEKSSPGRSVVLNIDAELQRAVYEILARNIPALGKKAGAAVISDPRDGRILALVSFPSFDSSMLSEGKDQEAIRAILNDKRKPFFNRAISGIYPPGSTIKPVLAAAALEEQVIDPKRTIYDVGFISVPNPYDPEKFSVFRDWAALGFVDMRRALALSANVYFYTIGGGHEGIKGLGIERIGKFFRAFGFGSKLGIDLRGEEQGLVPGPEEKKKIRPKDPFWRIGDTYITSIGQGDMGATPLQVNFATAAIANGGTLWRPFITKAILDEAGTVVKAVEPSVIRDRIAGQETLKVVREGMRLAVIDGSANAIAGFPLAVAGKTGTAQTGITGKNHGWFTAFVPYENPEAVITVMVEEGTGGATDAVPISKEILWAWLAVRNKSYPAE